MTEEEIHLLKQAKKEELQRMKGWHRDNPNKAPEMSDSIDIDLYESDFEE